MKLFMWLALSDGNPILIAIDHIVAIRPYSGEFSNVPNNSSANALVCMDGGLSYVVKETVESIAVQIISAGKK